MSAFIEAIKGGDLISAKKAFIAEMAPRTTALIEELRLEIARSILIEGEEPVDKEEKDEQGEKDEKSKTPADKGDESDESDDSDDEDDE